MEQNQLPERKARVEPTRNESQERAIPWSALESWVGVLLLVLLNVVLLLFVQGSSGAQLAQSAAIVFAELAYILPVVIVLAWKRASWAHLGFGKFSLGTMGIGCGLLIVGYGIIIVHNVILMLLGIDTQGREIFDILSALDSPIWLFIAAVIVAPIVEEIFFRGFLFQGFRKRYGWVPALLLSSAIFAAAHLDLASLIPTFILGLILTYMYHHSNSLWPGIILHFLINGTSTLLVYIITQFPQFIPS
jgi:membrane protease YdiL (CAAX protease family)